MIVIQIRRYVCRSCKAILMVVPRGIARCKHYAATAIAFALGLFGLDGWPQSAVRQAISSWRITSGQNHSTWVTLRRWIAAVADGALWPSLPRVDSSSPARQVAERAAMALSAMAPLPLQSLPMSHRAFHGGAHMA